MLKGISLIADIIKLAYVLAALLASVASADDYRPARPRKPAPVKIEAVAPVEAEPEPATAEPEPETEPLPPAASPVERPQSPDLTARDTAPGVAQFPEAPTETLPATDSRPVVYYFTTTNCAPCERLKKDIADGKLPWFRFENRPAPAWYVGSFPAFHYSDSAGKGRVMSGYVSPNDLVKAWRSANGGKVLRVPVPQVQPPMTGEAAFAQAAASTLPDQIRKFLGDEATILITPSMPINTAMDDGSIVKYSKISAHYKMIGNVPTLTIDDPKPQAWVRKFGIWFEADLQGARGNLDEKPPTATLKTSRGDVKIKIGLEPQ